MLMVLATGGSAVLAVGVILRDGLTEGAIMDGAVLLIVLVSSRHLHKFVG